MKKPASTLLILLLLLPNFLFLIPIPQLVAALVGSGPSGQPLPPGTVAYTNTWNSSALVTCAVSKAPSEALLPSATWGTVLKIPAVLFEGHPEGNNITQYFSLSTNGTFAVSDNLGNSFALGPPGGLPSGTVVASFKSNSTMAVMDFLDTSSGLTVSNLSAVFTVKKQFCQPTGLGIDLVGSANWGGKGNGTVSIPFKSKVISRLPWGAYFGNRSGIALGLDWSDSAALNPVYSAETNSLSYSVGSTFNIDPVTIGSSTSSLATAYSNQPNFCISNGYDWLFYFNGTSYVYRSSRNASVWNTANAIATSGTKAGDDLTFACSGSTVYRAILGTSSGSTKGWYFDTGTLSSRGTINWNTEVQVESSDVPGGFDYLHGPVGTRYQCWSHWRRQRADQLPSFSSS